MRAPLGPVMTHVAIARPPAVAAMCGNCSCADGLDRVVTRGTRIRPNNAACTTPVEPRLRCHTANPLPAPSMAACGRRPGGWIDDGDSVARAPSESRPATTALGGVCASHTVTPEPLRKAMLGARDGTPGADSCSAPL